MNIFREKNVLVSRESKELYLHVPTENFDIAEKNDGSQLHKDKLNYIGFLIRMLIALIMLLIICVIFKEWFINNSRHKLIHPPSEALETQVQLWGTKQDSVYSSLIAREEQVSYYNESSIQSKFDCLGGNTHYPLCIINNICSDGHGNWVIFNKEEPKFLLGSGEQCWTMQKFRLMNSSYDEFDNVQKGLHVLHQGYYEPNFGHVLGDDIWGIWQGLYLFNLLDSNATVLHDSQGPLAFHPSTKLYKLLPVSLKRYQPNDYICYEKLMMGWTKFGYALQSYDDYCDPKNNYSDTITSRYPWQGNFVEMMRTFREYTYNRMDIDRSKPRSQITFLDKEVGASDHPLTWKNINESIDAVRKAYPSIPVRKVSWYKMPMKLQVQIIHDTKILISLPGSDVMNAVWLNDGTMIVLAPRVKGTGCGNEFRLWYRFFHWVRTDLVAEKWIENLTNDTNHPRAESVNPEVILEMIDSFLSDEAAQQIRKPGEAWGSCWAGDELKQNRNINL